MTARILVVDDNAANRKLLEARLNAEYFDVMHRGERARGDRDMRRRPMRHRAARRDDAGDGRFRGLPPPARRGAHLASADRHGDLARPARRPGARARRRRRRFRNQADRRGASDCARALARPAQARDRRTEAARRTDGAWARRSSRPRAPTAGARRVLLVDDRTSSVERLVRALEHNARSDRRKERPGGDVQGRRRPTST